MISTRPRTTRRVAVVAAALPLLTLAACGQATQSKRASVESDLHTASDHMLDSKAVSMTLAIEDSKDTLRAGLLKDSNPPPAQLVDSLLGGTVSMTIDPTGSRTLRDLQKVAPTLSPADQLKAVNASFSVQADGGAVAELRLADGDAYVRVDLKRVQSLADKSGSGKDLSAGLDSLESSASPQLKPLVTDLKAGKWIRVPLAAYADRLSDIGKQSRGATPTPTPSVDSKQLSDDLIAAIRPFVQVTDAGGNEGKRVLDVKIQAKQALRALLDTLKRSVPAASSLGTLDSGVAEKLRDGTVNGTVTLKDGHLTTVTADLQSFVAVAPADPEVPDLSGSTLRLAIDDNAKAVDVPTDVSSYDVGSLLDQVLARVPGAARTLPS